MRRSLSVAIGLLLTMPAGAGAHAHAWSYLNHPTDQLGVPGVLAGVEVTPEGGLFTGWGETTFRFGPGLTTWRQPRRTLAEDRWPVLSSVRRRDGVSYTLTVFCDLVEGRAVAFARVVMRGEGRTPHVGRFAAGIRDTGGALKADGVTRRFRFPRPATPETPGLYTQPGAAFSSEWAYAFRGDTVTRDGAVVLTVPPGSARQLRPDGTGPVRPSTVFGLAGVHVRLAPGASATADFRMPIEPVPATSPVVVTIQAASFDEHRRSVIDAWRERVAGAMTVDLPEAKVRNAYTASLVNILVARSKSPQGEWVQAVNKLRYQAFWLRDAAMMTNALDRVGLFTPAGENLPFFARWQREDGLFISRPGQYDGIGQALWAIGEHALRSGDDALGRAWLARMDAAIGWISRARAGDARGLLPPGDPRDNELVAGHLPGDDFWAVAGLEAAVAVARRLRDDERATAWQRELDGLTGAVRAAVGTRAIPPALDAAGGADWGNLWAAWPGAALGARSAAVTRTLARARRRFREGIATWGPRRVLHGYLGFRVFETELERGEQAKVIAGLYASLRTPRPRMAASRPGSAPTQDEPSTTTSPRTGGSRPSTCSCCATCSCARSRAAASNWAARSHRLGCSPDDSCASRAPRSSRAGPSPTRSARRSAAPSSPGEQRPHAARRCAGACRQPSARCVPAACARGRVCSASPPGKARSPSAGAAPRGQRRSRAPRGHSPPPTALAPCRRPPARRACADRSRAERCLNATRVLAAARAASHAKECSVSCGTRARSGSPSSSWSLPRPHRRRPP